MLVSLSLEVCWGLGLYATLKADEDGLVGRKASLLSEQPFEPPKIVATLEDLPTAQGMPTSFAIAE